MEFSFSSSAILTVLGTIAADPSKLTPPIVVADANLVAVAAFPVVFWLPDALTPGRLILAEPLKLTPPIVLAVSKVVAVAALPDVSWLPAALTPGRLILAEPSKLTPPIVLAVSNVVAVEAFPERAAVIIPALKFLLASLHTIVEAVFALVASDVTVNVPPSESILPEIPFPEVAPFFT